MECRDNVAGGQIGNLAPRHSWMEWDLASPVDRDRQIADAIATIRRLALPYFALFEDIPSLVARLTAEDIPSFQPSSVLDFLMGFGTPADALQAARGMLRRLPEARQRYLEALTRFRSKGLPPHTTGHYGEVLAAATILFGFPDLTIETD